jgi:hypothetical protein
VVLGQAVIGVGSSAALVGFVWQHRQTRWAGLLLLSMALVLALIALAHMLAVRPRRWFATQVAAYTAVLLVFYHFHETPSNNERSPKALCAELAPLIDGTHRALLVSKLPEEVAFYLPLHPPEGPAPSRYVVVIDDQKGVRERARRNSTEVPSPAPQEFQGWFADAKVIGVRRVPMSAAPGDARYKVYELTVSRSGLALR